jgi:transcriptional regulator with XRE-family HTH domain
VNLNRQRFAANMKRARLRLGLSQEELGFRCKLNRTTISHYERGSREPGIDAVIKLAAGLETTATALCEGISWLSEEQRFEVEPPPPAPN